MTARKLEISPNIYYTQDEAAAMLRVPSQALRRLLNSGVARGIKIGRQWRILGNDLLLLPQIDHITDAELVRSVNVLSAPTFRDIWHNDEDSVYDEL